MTTLTDTLSVTDTDPLSVTLGVTVSVALSERSASFACVTPLAPALDTE